MSKNYIVLVYGDGSYSLPTISRRYATARQAVRYQDAWIARGVIAIAEWRAEEAVR